MELILFSLFTICVVSLLNYEKGVTIKQLTDVPFLSCAQVPLQNLSSRMKTPHPQLIV